MYGWIKDLLDQFLKRCVFVLGLFAQILKKSVHCFLMHRWLTWVHPYRKVSSPGDRVLVTNFMSRPRWLLVTCSNIVVVRVCPCQTVEMEYCWDCHCQTVGVAVSDLNYVHAPNSRMSACQEYVACQFWNILMCQGMSVSDSEMEYCWNVSLLIWLLHFTYVDTQNQSTCIPACQTWDYVMCHFNYVNLSGVRC